MPERRKRSEEKAEVNRNVRVAVRRFDVPGIADETWTFLCECGAEDCKDWVTLTLAEYEALRAEGEPIVVPGHELTRGQKARNNARKLADDAKALRAQADVQNKRAERRQKKP